ncbi:MAG: AMP-binding protein, partial [Solirubrobacterales bacterium]|nr:AMP-binding protein [Solirubrobacterales bacterium]
MRIVDLLDRGARLYPDKLAVAVAGGERVTHAELAGRAGRLAGALARLGVGRGDRVALLAGNGLAHFDVDLACARLGAAAVPLGTRSAPEELAHAVGDSEPAVAIADAEHGEALAAACPEAPLLEHGSRELAARLARDGDAEPPAEPAPGDTALIVYTSGTTGTPKGVCLSQHALCFNAVSLALAQRIGHDDVFLSTTPLYHAASGTRVVTMLLDGQTHVVLPRFDVDSCLEAIGEHGVTSTVVVPTQLQRLLDSPALAAARLATLRLIVYGAAPTRLETIRRAIDELPCGLFQGYGTSEACSGLTGLLPSDHVPGVSDERLRSCGRALVGVELRVCGEDGAELASGEVGEVRVRSEKTMTGYWRRPEQTAEVLRDGWLCTGDLGQLDERGYLTLAGRARDLIISGGVNVYPSEIERVLGGCPGVREAAVVGTPDREWGEAPVAFVVADGPLDPEALRAACAERLARLKVPRRFEVVAELPRTAANGKVRKGPLRERA